MLPAAAFMDKRDHPVHLWKIAQSLGSTEVVGNGAHRGGGAVHCGDDGYIVPGAHTSVGTAISLKQASLRLLHVVHKAGALSTKFERRLQGGLATSFSFSKPQIMGMNPIARSDIFRCEPDNLPIFAQRLAHTVAPDRKFMPRRNVIFQQKSLRPMHDRGPFFQRPACHSNVILLS